MTNLTDADRCPKCKSTDVVFGEITEFGARYECESCGYEGEDSEFWATREELGLSPTHCEACNRTLMWGCGHTYDDELAAIEHRKTTDHLLGDCECYVSRPGYAAYFTREQRRENIANVIRVLDQHGDEPDLEIATLVKELYAR